MWKLIFFTFLCGYSNALTDAEAKLKFVKYLLTCTKDIPVSFTKISDLQNLVAPTDPDTKCLLACAYKNLGTMDNKGMYDIKKAYEIAEVMKEGDDKRVENGKKVADICSAVNKEEVSDGEKGCERAALMFNCIVETAPKYGFNVQA